MADIMSSIFGGDNQVGFMGGGQYRPDTVSYGLPGFEDDTKRYQNFANQAMGMQTPMRQATPQEQNAQVQQNMLAVAGGKMDPTQVTQNLPQQVAAGPAQQSGPDWRQQQGQLVGNLFGTLNGSTPSVAQQQLQQTTQGNVANAFAMAQSGRYNPGAARQALNQGAMANQQAAGQGAMLRAQEQQNAQGTLGNILGTARGQDYSGAQGFMAQNLQAQGMQQQGNQAADAAKFAAFQNAQQNALGGKLLTAGSNVAAAFAHMSHGGRIPGHASGGDSSASDTVPIMASPGEIILPRSITMHDDAPELAKAFVAAIHRQRMGHNARKAA